MADFVPRSEFATIIGCSKSMVTAYGKAGRLVCDAAGNVDVAASIERINATADPGKAHVSARHAQQRGHALATAATPAAPPAAPPPAPAGEADAGDEAPGTLDYQTARARREHYAALAAQRDYQVSMGLLLNADEVTAAVAAAVTALRARIEALPDEIAPQVVGLTDEGRVRGLVAELVEHALQEASRQLAAVAAEPFGRDAG